MDWKAFELRIVSTLQNLLKLAAPATVSVTFSKYASEQEENQQTVEEFEKDWGKRLPESFRRGLIEYSPRFECYWSLGNDERNYPLMDTLGVVSGELSWSLEAVKELRGERDDFRSSDGWSDPWENKMPFYSTHGTGMLAIDTSVDDGGVYYLSTCGEDALDNLPLGTNFLDFLDRASRIAFADAEHYKSFVTEGKGLDLKSEYARQLRKKLRID